VDEPSGVAQDPQLLADFAVDEQGWLRSCAGLPRQSGSDGGLVSPKSGGGGSQTKAGSLGLFVIIFLYLFLCCRLWPDPIEGVITFPKETWWCNFLDR